MMQLNVLSSLAAILEELSPKTICKEKTFYKKWNRTEECIQMQQNFVFQKEKRDLMLM